MNLLLIATLLAVQPATPPVVAERTAATPSEESATVKPAAPTPTPPAGASKAKPKRRINERAKVWLV